jgi:hypothetical protein
MLLAPSVKTARCAACQLQLCKSRDEPPHSSLSEVTRDNGRDGLSVNYLCQNCGVTMIRSADLAEPGWSSLRR